MIALPPNWERKTFKLERPTRVVDIFCMDSAWVEVARRYWRGEDLGLEVLVSSPYADVQCGRLEPDGPVYYFKRFLMRDWRDRLKHLFRASRARRDLMSSMELNACGLSAPRAVCLIEERRWGRVVQSGLITREIEGAHTVREFLKNPERGVADDPARKQSFIKAFAAEVARLHELGFHHGDSRIGNILCREESDGFHFFWLDNERTKRFAPLPDRLRVHNLMQVNTEPQGASPSDRMRFWKAYREKVHLTADKLKAVRNDTLRWTQKRWRKRGWM